LAACFIGLNLLSPMLVKTCPAFGFGPV